MYPASLTKVMTAVVVLDHADELDAVVEAPADMFPALWEQNASMAGLQPGESATVEDMLYGLMLPSGADCAIALARYVAGDVEAFVELMNRTAAALGMSGTHFTNPTGLHDADHYSTARDMPRCSPMRCRTTPSAPSQAPRRTRCPAPACMTGI